ncbi:MAG TPA: coenzyme F420-0:L-glutamate ligase, partial [Candidatus Dormibacteraeota bacterium]|nr:coenzyme F420-0:L-glutamate ligase [Candidatus Dormibacteraeota bacterium]
MSRVIELIPVEGLPEVHAGDDVAEMICACVSLQPSDIVVVAQKIVSKSEGRTVDMTTIKASDEATSIAGRLIAKPDPRIVQVVLEESVRVLRSERVLITETRQGYVAANSGVDHSNVVGDNMVTLLPVDPDDSAARLRARIASLTGVDVGVIISDTFGRPWRIGIVNVALGLSGLPAVVDLRGTPDDAG